MKLFTPRDVDGFFALFIDNLVQMLIIVQLCMSPLCGMDANLVLGRIFPGVAVSILVGNLFYAWQAHRLAKREGRDDVTALPYGINTPSMLVYILFVIAPTYERTKSAELAWTMGLIACLGSGVIELAGSLIAGWVRERTPRAALLSTLSGIAIAFIAMPFALQIWSKPIVAVVPMGLVLLTLFARLQFPFGLPGGLVALLVGTTIAWLGFLIPGSGDSNWSGVVVSPAAVAEASKNASLWLPHWYGGLLWEHLSKPAEWLPLLSFIIPMGLFNVIGSLQNIESAEAAGDRFHTGSSLAVNGVGTILAALFGSCFPTTIYIGHPGWKALGARSGYSVLNGLVVTALCLTGTVGVVAQVVPVEAAMAIVVWIGIIITAQAFQTTPGHHAPAVAFGLFPSLAAMSATVLLAGFDTLGRMGVGNGSVEALLRANPTVDVAGFWVHGLVTMERGFIFACMILAAISAHLIERQYIAAAIWSWVAAGLTAAGLMHAYQLKGNTVDHLLIGVEPMEGWLAYRGYELVAGYALLGALFLLVAWYARFTKQPTAAPDGPASLGH